MVWDPFLAQWEENFKAAKLFYDENGHLYIPKNYYTCDGINLGAWIQNQRSKYRHQGDGYLTKSQIDKLETIGMIWNPYDDKWMCTFSLAKEYYLEHGNLLVPEKYVVRNEKLGYWISRQRRKYIGKRGSLTLNQKELLSSIGMVWDLDEVRFEEKYNEAVEYYKLVGDLEIENSYTSPKGTKLGFWISNLRRSYKQKSLSSEKIDRLEKIGMQWSIQNSPAHTSYPEQVILYYIKRELPETVSRYRDLGFELDIYIPSIRVAIEYDGSTWHKHECSDCGNKFTAPVDGISGSRQMTERLEDYLRKECFIQPFTILAERTGFTVATISNIMDEEIDKYENHRKLHPMTAPRVLGIDEKHINHEMRGVLVDVENGKLLDMNPYAFPSA